MKATTFAVMLAVLVAALVMLVATVIGRFFL